MRNTVRAILLATLLPAVAHAASVYNAAADFSIANGNPNGAWTYGYGTTTTTPAGTTLNFTPFNYAGSNFSDAYAGNYGFDYWSTGTNGFPVIGHAPGSGNAINHGSVNVPANELFLHPANGNPGLGAVLLFTVQTSGHYYVNGSFARRDTSDGSGDGTVDSIFYNGFLQYTGTNFALTYGAKNPFGNAGAVPLQAGDQIAFLVNNHGSYGSDSTGLDLTISQTPEPSSLMLLGTGVLSAAGIARRKLARS